MAQQALLQSYSRIFLSVGSAQRICCNILLLIALLDIVTSIMANPGVIGREKDETSNLGDESPLLISKAKIKRFLDILNTRNK